MDLELESKLQSSDAFAIKSDVIVFVAKDYKQFKLSEFNRDPTHYKKILESIKKNDYTKYQPILVDNSMNIVDGQNRFLACKALKLPIYFIVSKDIHIYAAADINQAGKNWSTLDYAHHYAKRGKPAYIRLLDLCAKYDQRISVVFAFGKMSDSVRSHTENVKGGNFEFRDDVNIDEFFEHMKIFNVYYSFSKKEKFTKTVLKLYINKAYDKKIMENKLRMASGIVHEQSTVEMMTEELVKLYNYRNRKPIVLKKNSK